MTAWDEVRAVRPLVDVNRVVRQDRKVRGALGFTRTAYQERAAVAEGGGQFSDATRRMWPLPLNLGPAKHKLRTSV